MTTPDLSAASAGHRSPPHRERKWNSGGWVSHSHGEQEDQTRQLSQPPQPSHAETLVHLRVIIGGQDVTFFRGTPVQVEHVTTSQPFGPETATLIFPQITPFDDLTSDEFLVLPKRERHRTFFMFSQWRRNHHRPKLVDRCRSEPNPETVDGHAGKFELVVEAQGILFASVDGVLSQPQIAYDTEDIGTVIPRILNTLRNGDTDFVRDVHTGIQTRSTGAWNPRQAE